MTIDKKGNMKMHDYIHTNYYYLVTMLIKVKVCER